MNFMEEKRRKTAVSVAEWMDAAVFAVVVCVVIFSLFIKVFTVNGSSMEPTYVEGDRVFTLLCKFTVRNGDVIVTDVNNGLGEPLIKRVIATEYQKVEMDPETGELRVDGKVVDTPVATTTYNLKGDITYPFYVPAGYVFAVGDNREWSLDCRYQQCGLIDSRSIVGVVIYVS